MLRRKGGARRAGRLRACASLISDVYIQERARMLVVSRCWVSDHAAIASKSQDTKAAALDEARRNYEKASRNLYLVFAICAALIGGILSVVIRGELQ